MGLKGFCLIFLCYILCSCARAPLKEPSGALRESQKTVAFHDGLPLKGLEKALNDTSAILSKSNTKDLRFGAKTITAQAYAEALNKLAQTIRKNPNSLSAYLKENFEVLEVYGGKGWGQVFITGYFEPVIKGSRIKKEPWTQPLYNLPKDMVLIRGKEFYQRFPHFSFFAEGGSVGPDVLRGRLVQGEGASKTLASVVPYYNRAEIDELKKLEGQKLEIVYVDPVDAFFLQIQGSGTVVLPSGQQLRVGYAGQNGYPYVPIGKLVVDKIPLDQITLETLEAYIRELNPRDRQALLSQNPSYVFFEEVKDEPKTSLNVPATEGRTIATDAKWFPKGALAWLELDCPKEPCLPSRLVLDQDVGGAIRGPGRVDLFTGRGADAKVIAGSLKNTGRLYYLFPKQ